MLRCAAPRNDNGLDLWAQAEIAARRGVALGQGVGGGLALIAFLILVENWRGELGLGRIVPNAIDPIVEMPRLIDPCFQDLSSEEILENECADPALAAGLSGRHLPPVIGDRAGKGGGRMSAGSSPVLPA